MASEYERLQSIVSRPEWDNLIVFFTNKYKDALDRLEECSPDGVRRIQGEITVIKQVLSMRETVQSIIKDGRK